MIFTVYSISLITIINDVDFSGYHSDLDFIYLFIWFSIGISLDLGLNVVICGRKYWQNPTIFGFLFRLSRKWARDNGTRVVT